METFNQGLTISLFGIGITFLVLAVVILLIRLILALFPSRPAPARGPAQESEADPNIPHVVAFAAAWWLQQQKDPSLGERLESPPGKWWTRARK